VLSTTYAYAYALEVDGYGAYTPVLSIEFYFASSNSISYKSLAPPSSYSSSPPSFLYY
jgi:hypothetical protein